MTRNGIGSAARTRMRTKPGTGGKDHMWHSGLGPLLTSAGGTWPPTLTLGPARTVFQEQTQGPCGGGAGAYSESGVSWGSWNVVSIVKWVGVLGATGETGV